MGDQVRIARVFPHCIQCPAKLRVPIRRPEHHDFPVTGDIPPPEKLVSIFRRSKLGKVKSSGIQAAISEVHFGCCLTTLNHGDLSRELRYFSLQR
jgi:hypothetical protein